jgi:sigma-B regulation protein RsbU (phosphoserine phosphatase)
LADTFGILGFLLLRETDGLASDDDKTNLATLLSMILANAMSVEQMHSVLDRDFAIAQHVQKRLLPQINPVVAQVDYHVVFSAARMVTGDFYDYVSDDSLRLNFIIGDVSGKGLGAALLMANIVPGIRSVISGQEGIQETMVRLHEHVYEAAPQGSYATLFYGCLDLLQMQFKYVNAGHQPLPFVLHAGRDGRLQELASGGSVLGLFKRPIKPFRVGRLIVQPGDVIVCATDGATDAQGPDGDPFGEERFQKAAGDLRKLSSSALDIAQGLYSEVIAHMSGTRQGDDITIGVFCVH